MPINRQNPQTRDPLGSLSLGLVDQLEDRCLCKAEALGSNPSKSIFMHPESKLSGKDGLPVLTRRYMKSCIGAVILDANWTWLGVTGIMLSGGWLGSRADEGRAKLR